MRRHSKLKTNRPQYCVSILLYADDIVLSAPSVTALQCLLEVCERELDNI